MTTVKASEKLLEEKKLKGEVEKKTGKNTEQLYEEREKRMMYAIALREPDRVPVVLALYSFPAQYAGIPPSAKYYDPLLHKHSIIKTLLDFEPDSYYLLDGQSGPALETLDPKLARWPGGPSSSDISVIQAIDKAVMNETEYDLFITDPGDFILRYYVPRTWGVLAPLSKLPPLLSLSGTSAMANQSARFSSPETIEAFQAIFKAGEEQARWRNMVGNLEEEMASLGIPPYRYPGGAGGAPFDLFADQLRGLPGVIVDMFRRPEKLIAACEKVLDWRLARAVPADPNQKWNPRRVSGGVAHFTSDRFLSKKQFETFVWPTWKKALLATIDLGFIPWLHLEGTTDDRLEYWLELPKGKSVIWFVDDDIFRAKEVLRDHACLAGNVSPILLKIGSPQEIEEYCKKLIKVCGKGGGFILMNSSVDASTKPANVRAMVDSVKKYGWY